MNSAKGQEAADPESLFLEAERHEEIGKFKNAFNCLLAAAKLGHASSQLNLGIFYLDGTGVRKNRKEAARWYKSAYKNGNRSGALNLAIDLQKQGKTRSAVVWLKKAIEMNEGSAYLVLAKIYFSRRGGRNAATDLLQKALLLNRSDISDDEMEEAKSLLIQIGGWPRSR
jgi:TPR repeat protein